ncbi:MAG TPA: MerC domain-containing protein [Sphingomonadaceae bacterium]|nr:MerC domain-containing protein [Sphingomonadaceae bacterium]
MYIINKPGRLKDLSDSLAIGVSFACLIHCLALPIVIALLPAWSAWLNVPESFHLWVFAFAFPFSLMVLIKAARGRVLYGPFWLGAAGLCIMGLGLVVGDPVFEAVITSTGAVLLASAHVLNWRRRWPAG